MEERNERDARVTRSNQEHFHSIKKTVVFLFTIVLLIERKRRQLRRGVVLRNCFSKEQFTQVSEFSVFVLSVSAITA